MKSLFKVTAAIIVMMFVTSCASVPSVFTDFDQSQSFDNYKKFSWISDTPMIVTGDQGPSSFVAARLQSAIKTALVQKGFSFVSERSDADFVVAYTVGARDKLDIREREVVDFYGPHWRWGYDYFGDIRPRGYTRTEVTTRQYSEGSLAIDIFDRERKSPVWHGSASKRLSRDELKGESEESTRMAVQTILAGFPPE